jgi:hypothetical protein
MNGLRIGSRRLQVRFKRSKDVQCKLNWTEKISYVLRLKFCALDLRLFKSFTPAFVFKLLKALELEVFIPNTALSRGGYPQSINTWFARLYFSKPRSLEHVPKLAKYLFSLEKSPVIVVSCICKLTHACSDSSYSTSNFYIGYPLHVTKEGHD